MSNIFLPRDPGQDTPEQAALRKELRAEMVAPPDFTEPTMIDLAIAAGREKRPAQHQQGYTLDDIHRVAARRLLDNTVATNQPEDTNPEGEDND